MSTLNLDILDGGVSTLSSAAGCFYREAALYCLQQHQEQPNYALSVSGMVNGSYEISSATQLNNSAQYTWADKQEATEYGAVGIAIVLVLRATEYTAVERSVKGTGFDYWLGDSDNTPGLPFERKARLECSGILRGDSSQVNSRVKDKSRQTTISDETEIDAYIVVVEFSNPMAKIIKR